MSKKPPVPRFSRPKANAARGKEWHNGAHVEIHLYARSLQKAAKALIEKLDWNEESKIAWDVGPIILLYRQALELNLKALVGEGCNFVPSPTDHITLYKTHSLRWLAQIVCQVIRTVQWEAEFKCDGIASLAEFTALIAELETMEPVSCAVHSNKRGRLGEIPELLRKPNVSKLIPRLDALVSLLESTSDALAATWDQRTAEADFFAGEKFGLRIQ